MTYAFLVPPIVLGLAKHPLVDKFDLSKLRAIVSGAAPLSDELEAVVRKGDVTADEVMAFVAENVAPYKKIRFVAFVEQIPKSSSGKILRRLLK